MKRFDEKDGTGVVRTSYGEFQHPVACKAKCPDGRIRVVRLNSDADTAYTWPGRCSIGGRTLRGVVMANSEGTLTFRPYVGTTVYVEAVNATGV